MAEEYPKVALVCTPHPDDAEIGAGGTLAKWIKHGAHVVLVVCTNGDKGSADPAMASDRLAQVRKQEQEEAARALGIKEVVFLGYPDGFIEDNAETRGRIVREIRRVKPDVLLTTDPHRRSFYLHHDHRVTGQLALDAVFPYARDHLFYQEHLREGLAPHKVAEVYLWGTDQPDTYVDVSETLETKIKALLHHKSQVSNPDRDPAAFLRNWAEENGKKAGVKYAEAFRRIQIRR
ncbi:MAG: PIG-L family deacetylase [Chloroflexi bacterium]|nr:PIG-L family deacetylase [Chloroflexota bacterium]